jgi:endonuclease/exonuclease/phosphatase family metal-dependent hydrolase
MPVFPKPTVAYTYSVATEVQRLRQHKQVRAIPAKTADTLLIGTWNIANLGAQARRASDHELIAEVLSWFDVIAVQECRDNFGDLYDIQHYMGGAYQIVMSDASGNNERMVFLYDSAKVIRLDEIGEIAYPPAALGKIKLKGSTASFTGFDRTPYLASFQLRGKPLSVQLVNVHLFYGSAADPADIERRALETIAVAKWTLARQKSKYLGAREVIALGDFNMPKPKPDGGNIVYDALTSGGLVLPPHSSGIGSSIASDNHYDQIAVFPPTAQKWLVDLGVFDFDQVVFKQLWQGHGKAVFNGYLRYYLSDHRPMWMRLRPV